MPRSYRRAAAGFSFALLLALTVAAPSPATHATDPRRGIDEIGFHGMENKGFNTDIMPWVGRDGRVYAATGTWGTLPVLGAEPTGDPCPSERDNPADPQRSGVWIVDATNPREPQLVSRIGTIPGSQNNDPKFARLPTTLGTRDLLIQSLEPCGAEGLFRQIPGSPFSDFATEFARQVEVEQTGFRVFDVDDPANPVLLGTYNNGGLGTHNLFPFRQGNRSFVAAVWNSTDFLGFESESIIDGELQVVEITDPATPVLIGRWRLADAADDLYHQPDPNDELSEAEEICPARGVDSAFCYLHDVWVDDDFVAYLSFWDAGLILVNLSGIPAAPTWTPPIIGQAIDKVQPGDAMGWLNEEGNTHVAVPIEVDGRTIVVVGDEDFTGGGSAGGSPYKVTVNAPGAHAGEYPAVLWGGTQAPDETGVTGDFIYVGAGCTPADYAQAGGPAAVSGKIVLVDHRDAQGAFLDCAAPYTFGQKVNLAAANGAVGLLQVPGEGDQPNANATAGAASIPGMELFRTPATLAFRDAVVAGTTVNATLVHGLIRGAPIDPWGFARMVDVTSHNDERWREVSQFKAPHVEMPQPDPADVFSAHNPIIGRDGLVYFAWYTDGLRVLRLSNRGARVDQVSWFAPRPGDHPDDNDEDPNQAQEANIGFWGSWPLVHPSTGETLVFNSDLNRGIYILGASQRGRPSRCPGFERTPGRHIVGTRDDEVLVGTRGRDVICGLAGRDEIRGRGGADVLVGGPHSDMIFGNAGADTLHGGGGLDNLRGGGGRDRLYGEASDDDLRGGGGRDRILGQSGNDMLTGGRGPDWLHGGPGEDRVYGGRGPDDLYGGRGRDLADGGSGRDRCRGGPGTDTFRRCEEARRS